jgi:hypothetical protein
MVSACDHKRFLNVRVLITQRRKGLLRDSARAARSQQPKAFAQA